MAPNPQKYYPIFDKDIQPNIQSHFLDTFTALNDHDQAITTLKAQLDAATTKAGTTTNITNITTSGGTGSLGGLGKVNPQTTDYVVQSTDAGSLITMTSAIATTITLNFTVTLPFFCFIENFGSAVLHLVPNNGALINGGASLDVLPNFYAIVFFDNQNWEAATLPLTTLQLETNGVANGLQSLFNLVAGSNVTLTDSGTGNITVAAAAGSAPTITTNANGTAVAFAGGYVHQFGLSAASPTGVAKSTVAVTFPVAFAGIPTVTCNVDNNADGFGTSVFSCYPSSITTTGFTANFAAGVIIGGSGAANITNIVHAGWEADFA